MAPLSREDAPAYLREEVVVEVTSFYDFLISMYLPDGVLQRAPPGGWPHLTDDKLALLNKDEAVLDLIRHLPYIATCRPESYDVHVECECMDYASPGWRSDINTASGQLWIYDMEPNREVTEMGSHEFTLSDGYAHPERSEIWERPKKFFEILKGQFRTFEVIKTGPTLLRWTGGGPTSAPRRAAGLLFRKHGWLTETYDKIACSKEVVAFDHLQFKGSEAVSTYAQSLLRDEIVRELTSFYEFLTRTHIPTKALRYPPLGGWPHLTREALAFMGKSDAVLDLIPRLPYILHPDRDEPYQIYDTCAPVDSTSRRAREAVNKRCLDTLQPKDQLVAIEPHEFMLAYTPRGDVGHYIALDLKTGKIRIGEVICGKTQYFDNASELFGDLKKRYRKMELLPVAPHNVHDYRIGGRGGRHRRMKEYFHNHGWMTDWYEKAVCMQDAQPLWDHVWRHEHRHLCNHMTKVFNAAGVSNPEPDRVDQFNETVQRSVSNVGGID